jgi:DNA-binding NtrC family response regulator
MQTKRRDGGNLSIGSDLGAQERMRRAVLDRLGELSAAGKRAHAGGHGTSLAGSSPPMQELHEQIRAAAGCALTILIRGATGTGKELIARAIHEQSNRANQPFVAVNCSAVPETLFESELFGYEAGAFTGARARHLGLFESANRGTLFLDEIGDLTLGAQVKLLRVLQEQSIQRLGCNKEVRLDVRVLAATHRDLEALMAEEKFRRDLFYRLNAFPIKSPQLCEIREDVPELIRVFLRKWEALNSLEPLSISREAVEFLQGQQWPGNARELESAVYRAAVLAGGNPIERIHVERGCARKKVGSDAPRHYRLEPLTDLVERAQSGEIKNLWSFIHEQAERSVLQRVKAVAGGNQSKMAKLLGVTRTTVRQSLRRLGF